MSALTGIDAGVPRWRSGPLQLIGSLFFTGFWFAWTFFYAIPFVIVCAFLPLRRRFALARAYAVVTLWVLKRELLWIPVVGLAVKQTHAIAIDRRAGHSAVAQVIEQGKARLAEGAWVMVYPEGTRMPIGETRRYGVSGTLLAIETGRLVVPVAHNAGYYWPRRGLLKKPGVVRVVVGPAFATAGREVRELNEEIQAWVEATVALLIPLEPQSQSSN